MQEETPKQGKKRKEETLRKKQEQPAVLTGVMSRVDTTSCTLRVDSISDTTRAGRRSVAMRVVRMQTMMPEPVMSRG